MEGQKGKRILIVYNVNGTYEAGAQDELEKETTNDPEMFGSGEKGHKFLLV